MRMVWPPPASHNRDRKCNPYLSPKVKSFHFVPLHRRLRGHHPPLITMQPSRSLARMDGRRRSPTTSIATFVAATTTCSTPSSTRPSRRGCASHRVHQRIRPREGERREPALLVWSIQVRPHSHERHSRLHMISKNSFLERGRPVSVCRLQSRPAADESDDEVACRRATVGDARCEQMKRGTARFVAHIHVEARAVLCEQL